MRFDWAVACWAAAIRSFLMWSLAATTVPNCMHISSLGEATAYLREFWRTTLRCYDGAWLRLRCPLTLHPSPHIMRCPTKCSVHWMHWWHLQWHWGLSTAAIKPVLPLWADSLCSPAGACPVVARWLLLCSRRTSIHLLQPPKHCLSIAPSALGRIVTIAVSMCSTPRCVPRISTSWMPLWGPLVARLSLEVRIRILTRVLLLRAFSSAV